MVSQSKQEPHVYDANLDPKSDLQNFFEGDNLVVATRFFRNVELFQQLETLVIPSLLESGLAKRKILRIWSAGCSDGREPYSLAMATRRILDELGYPRLDVHVRGSDLSRPQIRIAREGIYNLSSADQSTLKPYQGQMEVVEKNIWRMKDTIKAMVEFVVEDIIKFQPEEPFDIMICSLVMLYYHQDFQRTIVRQLVASVQPEGYFHIAPIGRRWLKAQGYEPARGSGPFFKRVVQPFEA